MYILGSPCARRAISTRCWPVVPSPSLEPPAKPTILVLDGQPFAPFRSCRWPRASPELAPRHWRVGRSCSGEAAHCCSQKCLPSADLELFYLLFYHSGEASWHDHPRARVELKSEVAPAYCLHLALLYFLFKIWSAGLPIFFHICNDKQVCLYKPES